MQTLTEYQKKDSKCANRHSFDYDIVLAPWLEKQKKPFSFDAEEDLYDRTSVGVVYSIPMHKGYFGHAWVDIEELKPAREAR